MNSIVPLCAGGTVAKDHPLEGTPLSEFKEQFLQDPEVYKHYQEIIHDPRFAHLHRDEDGVDEAEIQGLLAQVERDTDPTTW